MAHENDQGCTLCIKICTFYNHLCNSYKVGGVVTIDLQLGSDGVARPELALTKIQLAESMECSESTVKRIIALLNHVVPDEFAQQGNQRVYAESQAKMIFWVKVRLNAGFTYAQIEQELEEGFPDEQ